MKVCSTCKVEKPTSAFYKKARNADGLERYCKECHKERNKTHYLKNRHKYTENAIKYRRDYIGWMISVKESMKCVQCSEDHPATLDFHHTNPSTKEFTIAQAVTDKIPKSKVIEEISKCIVLCSNCHRKLHYNERNRDIV